jgi:hypothetical protein
MFFFLTFLCFTRPSAASTDHIDSPLCIVFEYFAKSIGTVFRDKWLCYHCYTSRFLLFDNLQFTSHCVQLGNGVVFLPIMNWYLSSQFLESIPFNIHHIGDHNRSNNLVCKAESLQTRCIGIRKKCCTVQNFSTSIFPTKLLYASIHQTAQYILWSWRQGCCKVKVKLSLCLFLTEHHAMKAYQGTGGIAPCILWPLR